jgi:hypothetical protein
MSGHRAWSTILRKRNRERGWTVTLAVVHGPIGIAGDAYENAVCDLTDALALHGGVVALDRASTRYDVTVSVRDVDDVESAIAAAREILATATEPLGLPSSPIVHVDARTFAEHDAELARPT